MSAYHATKPLSADMVLRCQSIDPKLACGPSTKVSEVWRVTAEGHGDHEAHFVYIGDHGRAPYCSRCGFDCASVAAVEQERAKRQAVRS